jgi:type IV pilus assembly protein PilC
MGRFTYTVQDSKGETSSGALDASDENEAINSLQGKGYFILSISSDQPTATAGGKKPKPSGSVSVATRDLVFFAEQLATLLNGGVPLVRALSLLGEHSSSKGLHFALGQVTKEVAGGTALYKALEKQPKVFDNLWISLVQAGEMGGQLPKVLKQISGYLSAQEELIGKVVTALAYPTVLGSMSLGVLAFFIIKIVPVFAEIFESFQVKLPPLTAAIVFFSNALVHHLPIIICVVIGTWFVWTAYTSTEAGQEAKWNLIFSVPFFGMFVKNIMVERLLTTTQTLGVCLRH